MLCIISPHFSYSWKFGRLDFVTSFNHFCPPLTPSLWQPRIWSLYLWARGLFFNFLKIPKISEIIWYLSFSLTYFIFSFIIMPSRCVHGVRKDIILFLWLNKIPLCTYTRGFPGSPSGKEPACKYRRHPGSVFGSGRSPGGGNGNPL